MSSTRMSLTPCLRNLLITYRHQPGLTWLARRPLMASSPTHQQVKMTKMLQKMMNKGGKKKSIGFHANITVNEAGGHGKAKKVTEGHRRRALQVGKVLYDYIADLVNSGELHPALVDSMVEISDVKVVPDFSAVNVYWVASGTEADTETRHLLDSNSGRLREMLIGLHVLGNVPRINFVQDMSQARMKELEALLSVADMGPVEDDLSDLELNVHGFEDQGQDVNNLPFAYTESEINRNFRKMSVFANTPKPGVSLQSMQTLEQSANVDEDWDKKAEVLNCQEDNSKLLITSQFRHDIYNLNRDDLADKVLMLKKKAQQRMLKEPSSINLSQYSVQPGKKPVKFMKKVEKVMISNTPELFENDEYWSSHSSRINEDNLKIESDEEYDESCKSEDEKN